MSAIAGPPSVLGLFASCYMLFILSTLSRRLGTVTKMKPYYRGLYVGMAFVIVAVLAHMLRVVIWLGDTTVPDVMLGDGFYFVTYYLPMALAVTISIGVVLRYWSWLFTERDR